MVGTTGSFDELIWTDFGREMGVEFAIASASLRESDGMVNDGEGSSAGAHGGAGGSLAQAEAWAAVELLVLDVDGVLTDGKIYQDNKGRRRRVFSVRDAIALRRWRKGGGRVAVVTAARSDDVREAVESIGVDFFIEACGDKNVALAWILKSEGFGMERVAVFAASESDLSACGEARFLIATRQADAAVRAKAGLITKTEAGDGAVAEACANLLSARPATASRRRRVGNSRV